MNHPGTPQRNDGIIIGGHASVSDAALAAGHHAHAQHHGSATQLDAVQRQLNHIRDLLARSTDSATAEGSVNDAAAGDSSTDDRLTTVQQTAVEEAVEDAEQALAAARSGSGLHRLSERLQLLAACLTGTDALAQAADRLRQTIGTLVS